MRFSRQALPRKRSVAVAFAGIVLACSVSADAEFVSQAGGTGTQPPSGGTRQRGTAPRAGQPAVTGASPQTAKSAQNPESAKTSEGAKPSETAKTPTLAKTPEPAKATEVERSLESTKISEPAQPARPQTAGGDEASAQEGRSPQVVTDGFRWWMWPAALVVLLVVVLSGLAYHFKRKRTNRGSAEKSDYKREERFDSGRREEGGAHHSYSFAQRNPLPSPAPREGEHVRELRSQTAELQRYNDLLKQRCDRMEGEAVALQADLRSWKLEQQRLLDAERKRIASIETRSIEWYFDSWKEQHFRRDYEEQIGRTRAEVSGSPENVRIIGECRLVHEQLLEKARPWFEAMDQWARAFGAAGSPVGTSDREWDTFEKRLREYVRRGRQFVANLDRMSRSDTDGGPFEGTIELAFGDVVWGRSGDLLTGGYRNRLLDRLAKLKRSAESSPADWEQLREEVLPLIDEYQGMTLESARHRATISMDAIGERVRDAWRIARLEEICIEPGATEYNPGIHEAVATQSRPDVPDKTILRVERPGFYCDSKVFRRALVVVSSADASRAVQA